jgi:uncharacterized membrane protein YfcA
VFEYIEAFYNRQRRHSTLGMLSPVAYEQQRLSPLGGWDQSLEQQQSATTTRCHANRGRSTAAATGSFFPAGLFSVSVYNGYFGAGAGVMVLVLLLLTADQHIARANALKNMLVGVATVVSAATIFVFGSVDWTAAVPWALGMFVGSTVGASIARQLPSNVLRWLVTRVAIGLAVRLWVAPS